MKVERLIELLQELPEGAEVHANRLGNLTFGVDGTYRGYICFLEEVVECIQTPLNLSIGDWVHVNRTCEVAYDGDDKRLFFEDYNSSAVVIGVRKKALGKYVKGGGTCLTFGLGLRPAVLAGLPVRVVVRVPH